MPDRFPPRQARHGFPFRRRAPALVAFLLQLLGAALAAAAEAPVERFLVPAGDAGAALQAFARQTTAQVIYMVDQVQGVRTNAIDGEFTAGDALDRILRGTRLRSMRDERTGALAVFLEPARPDTPAEKAPPPARVPRLAAWLSRLAEPAPTEPGRTADQRAIRLSPFEVSEAQDNSFRTSSVGSGSRLAMELSDVTAAYSVINRAYIDTLGITDVTEAASWAPGQTFNFENTRTDRFGQQGTFVSRGFQTAPSGSNVMFSNNTGNQLNFYQSGSSASDAYAIETYDFGRGPNSALFGMSNSQSAFLNGGAGLSGTASSQTKRARADATQTSIQAEAGSWGYHRATLDHNRVLGRGLAVRLNLVDSDQTGYQHMKYTRNRGIHLTGTWMPTARTTVTITGINSRTQTKNPGIDVSENWSGWDGQTVFRGPVLNSFLSTTAAPGSTAAVDHPVYGQIRVLGGPDPATGEAFAGLTFNGEPQGVNRRPGNAFLLDPSTRTIMDWEHFALTRPADSTSRVPVWSATAPNGAYFVRSSAAPANGAPPPAYWDIRQQHSFLPVRRGEGGMPPDMFDRGSRRVSRPLPGPRDSMAGGTPNTIQWFKDAQFAVDRSLGENLYLSIGGDVNRTHAYTRNDEDLNGLTGQHVDINVLRPDGTPNPHFLDLYSYSVIGQSRGGLRTQDQWTDDQALRANVVYRLNAGRWGQYTLNLNANANTRNYQGNTHSWILPLPGLDPRQANAALLNNAVYHSDRERVDPASVVDRELPFTNLTYNAAGIPTVTTSMVRPRLLLRGVQIEQTTSYLTRYLILQTQAKYLGNRLVVTLTGKRQFDKSQRLIGVDQGDLPGPVHFTNPALGISSVNPYGTTLWDGQSEVFKPVWGGAPADYYALTYQPLGADGRPFVIASGPQAGQVAARRQAIARPRVNDTVATNGALLVRDPRYQAGSPHGEQLFRDDFSPPVARISSGTYAAGVVLRPVRGLSPFVNFSSQTIPPDFAQLDLDNAVRRVVQAREVAFGASIDVGTRLNFKWNYYRNTRLNNTAASAPIGRVNDLVNSRSVFDDLSTSMTNSLGIAPLNNADYTTNTNQGYEIELTLSDVVPGLRVIANGSAGSTGEDQRTRFPLTKRFMLDPENQRMMKELLEHAGGTLDPSQRPSRENGALVVDEAPGLAIPTPGVAPTASFALDQARAVNAYNNAWVEYDQLLDQLSVTRTRRGPYANFYADYTVQAGPVRGLGIGAGVQWQGLRNAYNKGGWTIVDPADPTRAIDDPRYTSRDIGWVRGARNYQANLSYTFRLAGGGSLRLGLRINNPLDDRTVIHNYGLQQPGRDLSKPNRVSMPHGVARFTDPRNFRLTTTYSFRGGSRR